MTQPLFVFVKILFYGYLILSKLSVFISLCALCYTLLTANHLQEELEVSAKKIIVHNMTSCSLNCHIHFYSGLICCPESLFAPSLLQIGKIAPIIVFLLICNIES